MTTPEPRPGFRASVNAAREAGDANAYAQLQIKNLGLEQARELFTKEFADEVEDYIETRPHERASARKGFYHDVATLLRLETASDEGAE